MHTTTRHIDLLIMIAISSVFFDLIMFDGYSWYYSAIGDEYAFFVS